MIDNYDDMKCDKCGRYGCDGLKGCDQCGNDTSCQNRLCSNCHWQESIDNDPHAGDPAFSPFSSDIPSSEGNSVVGQWIYCNTCKKYYREETEAEKHKHTE